MPGGAPKILIPRWIQLVGLPLLLLFLWVVVASVRHVVFLFIVASLIALFLDSVVRIISRMRVPRGLAIAAVYLVFAIAVLAALVALGTVVVSQTKTASKRFDAYFTKKHGPRGEVNADRDVDRLQEWLDTHGLSGIQIRKRGHKLVRQIQDKDVGKYTGKVVNFVEGAAISIGKLIFDLVLIFVVSIYMLLGLPRLTRLVDRRFPPTDTGPLLPRMSQAVGGYVKGQMLVSLIIGTSVGVGMWVLGATGAVPGADGYALLFGVWAGITELIPYLGPWLGAIPAVIYALVVHPLGAVWVILLFLGIHQIEGHVVIPNVMGSALRLHPLLIIFGLLAGGEIYGFAGVLVVLPFLAACRAAWEFFSERISLEPWRAGPVPVEVEVEHELSEPSIPVAPEPSVPLADADEDREPVTVVQPPDRAS
jgi:predicted PurR-regulated permease PerM